MNVSLAVRNPVMAHAAVLAAMWPQGDGAISVALHSFGGSAEILRYEIKGGNNRFSSIVAQEERCLLRLTRPPTF
jgi:hypothetical protein